MKLLFIFACSVLVGCGLIFGLVHGIVPHLVAPQLFPDARASEPPHRHVQQTLTSAGAAVRSGVERSPGVLVADSR